MAKIQKLYGALGPALERICAYSGHVIYLTEGAFLYPHGLSKNAADEIFIYSLPCHKIEESIDPYLSEGELIRYAEDAKASNGEIALNISAAIERVLKHNSESRLILIVRMNWQNCFMFLAQFYENIFENIEGRVCEAFSFLELRRQFYLNQNANFELEELKYFFDRLDLFYKDFASKEELVNRIYVTKNLPIEKIGFEFQLINYFMDPSSEKSHLFAARATHVIKKQLIKDFVEEVALVIIKNHFRIRQIKNGEIQLYSLNDFNIEWDILPKIKSQHLPIWLIDPMFNENNVDYAWSTYDLKELVKTRDSLLTLTEVTEGETYHGISSPLFTSDLKFEEIIKFERASKVTRILFNRFQYDAQVNSYIVDLALSHSRNSQ